LNKLSQFWQELKRRKVVRVITVYAAAAFVILELMDIIVEPLKLPEWFLPMVIVLLCIGFIIAIILSWIYDVKPEVGIVKTEPAHGAKREDQPSSSSSWKIASYISFLVIVVLIVLNILPRSNRSEEIEILDKSIAVLPFINDSPEQENDLIIDGYMMSILNNLSMIEDLKVIPRPSIEQYRNSTKPIPEIAKELNVSYLLYASGQKLGDNIRLTIQLYDPDEATLWSHQYDNKITKVEDHITLQSSIAQSVAKEIDARITPEEAELINKIPTTNLAAYEFYTKGLEKYHNGELENAEDLFHYALEADSTYAKAYVGLARVYWDKQYWEDYLLEEFLDSSLWYANTALSYDNQLPEAYGIRGEYYEETGNYDQALKDYDQALDYNPNYIQVLLRKGPMLAWTLHDPIQAISTMEEAHSRISGDELPDLLVNLGWMYGHFGFPDIARKFHFEALSLDGDSARYFERMGSLGVITGNFKEGAKWYKKAYVLDSTDLFWNGYIYSVLGDHDEAYRIHKRLAEKIKNMGEIPLHNLQRIGYAFWMVGEEDEAAYYFNEKIRYSEESIRLDREYGNLLAYYSLATVYAFLGERTKAFQNLEIFIIDAPYSLYFLNLVKHDPLFNSIREEERFQNYLKQFEDSYQAEHERVRKWLEENDML